MANLQYDLKVVGAANIERALATLERRFVAHNQRMKRTFGAGTAGARPHRGGYRDAAVDAARSVERRRHSDAMAHISAEERARIRAEHRIHRIARRNQLRRARENRRNRLSAEREQARSAAKAKRDFRRNTVAVVRGTGSTLRTGMGYGVVAAGLMGSMQMASAVDSMIAGDKAKRELANQAFSQGGGESREQILARISARTRGIAATSGRSEAESAEMLRSFVGKAGGLDQALALAPFMSDLADATGSEMSDVGEAAGSVFAAAIARGMKPDEAKAAVKEIITGMAGQAKEGSIELKDLANLMGRIMSSGAKFKGEIGDVATTMGAFAQIALSGGASSAEEATTATMRLGPDIAKNEGAFMASGVNIWADKGKTQLRAPEEVLFDAIGKTKGNQSKLLDMFNAESAKIVDAFVGAYTGAGGGKSGEAAMRALLGKFKDLAMSPEELRESAAFQRESTYTKLGQLRERFNDKIGPSAVRAIERMIPALEKLAPHLETAADKVAGFVEWFAANPLKGIGAIVLAAIAKEIAAAGIADAIRRLLTPPAIPGAPGVPGSPTIAPATPNQQSTILGLSAATAALTAGYAYGKEALAKGWQEAGLDADTAEKAGGVQGALMAGNPLALIGDYLARAGGDYVGRKLGTVDSGPLQAGPMTSGAVDVQAIVAAAEAGRAQQVEAAQALKDSAAAQQQAAAALAASVGGGGGGRGGGPNRGNGPTTPP